MGFATVMEDALKVMVLCIGTCTAIGVISVAKAHDDYGVSMQSDRASINYQVDFEAEKTLTKAQVYMDILESDIPVLVDGVEVMVSKASDGNISNLKAIRSALCYDFYQKFYEYDSMGNPIRLVFNSR